MAKNYVVNWSNNAIFDLNEIIDYIAENKSIDMALEKSNEIQQNANKLYKLPDRYRHVPELQKHNILTYREIIVTPWRIIYKIDENIVWVETVIDGRRNIEDILLKKLLSNKL